MKEAKEKERETLKNEQKNPFSGENSVIVKRQKTQNTKKGWRPTAPRPRAGFFCCPFGLLMVTYRLRIPCSLQKCRSSCFFLLLVFCFSFFGGCVSFFLFPCLSLLCSLFLILLFLFPAFSHCVTKKPRSNHRISEMFVLMFRFGACILAVSLGPAKNPYSDQRWKWYLFHFYGS